MAGILTVYRIKPERISAIRGLEKNDDIKLTTSSRLLEESGKTFKEEYRSQWDKEILQEKVLTELRVEVCRGGLMGGKRVREDWWVTYESAGELTGKDISHRVFTTNRVREP